MTLATSPRQSETHEWINYLTPDELAQLDRLLLSIPKKGIDYSPHKPFPPQQSFLDIQTFEAFYGGAAGGGKGVSLSVDIHTPDGLKTFGQIQPGDFVFGLDGKPTRVLASTGERLIPCYRVTFDDGSAIECDEDHRWLTLTVAEREAARKRTPEARSARQAKRESKSTGKRPDLSQMNAERSKELLPPPAGIVRGIAEIYETQTVRNGRVNHAVPVAPAIHCQPKELPIPPYTLGIWLGDGTSASGRVTTPDPEVLAFIRADGFAVVSSDDLHHGVHGLSPLLRKAGLLGNKHVPAIYLHSSEAQRIALLQGLLDSDGACNADGQIEFTSTREALSRAVYLLASSLGYKATMIEAAAKLNGVEVGRKWTVKWTPMGHRKLFRLARKGDRQKAEGRGVQSVRYMVKVEKIEPVPSKCIKVESEDGMFLIGANLIPTHNSDAILMAGLEYVDRPDYAALILRKTFKDLALPGAIMDRAKSWLIPQGVPWSAEAKKFTFPNGGTLTFGYLDNEDDIYQYQGSEFQYIGFDELTQFSETQYRYLLSRCRRTLGSTIPLRVRGAGNPGGKGHEWVKERFVESGNPERPFIPAKIMDNPALDRVEYEKALSLLSPLLRSQLLAGDWDAIAEGTVFDRSWFIDDEQNCPCRVWVRYWDIATSAKQTGDWTVGAMVGLNERQEIVIKDIIRFKHEWPDAKTIILETSETDYHECKRFGFSYNVGIDSRMSQQGYVQDLFRSGVFGEKLVPLWPDRTRGDKKERASGWAARAQQFGIRLRAGGWRKAFIAECVAFTGTGDDDQTDDQVDAISGAYQLLWSVGKIAVQPKVKLPIQPGSKAHYDRLARDNQKTSY